MGAQVSQDILIPGALYLALPLSGYVSPTVCCIVCQWFWERVMKRQYPPQCSPADLQWIIIIFMVPVGTVITVLSAMWFDLAGYASDKRIRSLYWINAALWGAQTLFYLIKMPKPPPRRRV